MNECKQRMREVSDVVVAVVVAAADVVAAVVVAAGAMKPMRSNPQRLNGGVPYWRDQRGFQPWQRRPPPLPLNFLDRQGIDDANMAAEPSKRRTKTRH